MQTSNEEKNGCPKGKLLSITDQQLTALAERVFCVFHEEGFKPDGNYKQILISKFMEKVIAVHRENHIFYSEVLNRLRDTKG